jgi:hypothetical protein
VLAFEGPERRLPPRLLVLTAASYLTPAVFLGS